MDAVVAGATAGILGEVMVYRLNPEVSQTAVSILTGAVMWASWGALGFGLPLFLVAVVVRRIARRRGGWSVPALVGVAYLVAGIMSKVNADLHEHLLSPSARLVMRQDAVAWGGGALIALLGGVLVWRRGATPRLRYGFALVLMVLPLVRFLTVSTPPDFPLEVATRAIGEPERRLVVVMRLVLGCSIAEIAAQTEMKPNTVRDRLAKGRAQLREGFFADPVLNELAEDMGARR